MDPDPLASYRVTVKNTTGGPMRGFVVLSFDIAPAAGGDPSHSSLEIMYDPFETEEVGTFVQHHSFLTEDGGREVCLNDITLTETITSGGVTALVAGPVPLPDPKRGPYVHLDVQLAFSDFAPGDSAVFTGITRLPEPARSLLLPGNANVARNMTSSAIPQISSNVAPPRTASLLAWLSSSLAKPATSDTIM